MIDRFPIGEAGLRPDFLNEGTKVTFEVEPDAFRNLPVISSDDEQTGRERFRILLGQTKVRGRDQAHVVIKGVLEAAEGDTCGMYAEGKEHTMFHPEVIETQVRDIQHNPEYRDFNYLGHIHTHPHSMRAEPSDEDLRGYVDEFERHGDDSRPYIFGIAGKTDNGEMVYWFYRLVKTGAGYTYQELEHPEDI